MRMRKVFQSRIFLLLLALFVAAGCSGEKYGAGIDPDAPMVTVSDVYLDNSLLNQVVNLEGTIISQCGSPDKCWYFMEDETGRILINLKPAKFVLPAAIGKTAKVTGTVQGGRDGYQIIAQGVEIL